ncbi:hypothetical protein [Acidipila rosea]|uniref:Outer membrane protein beta-barrel domain-containing protein n=1 Tax=Acidipila rosea TaxID=768535 RepID=A0A4R1LA46_9BACT|nr:hypothetical protein [Acidipila rosea]MBW4026966.1 hypothetical protein [Acidobacteriota bacterium]MBW4045034.1 hypothetical protein [Acidobacteriota bacterium]TCK75268.1 hypothetical protein C7378_0248 [Acidipila rosea]
MTASIGSARSLLKRIAMGASVFALASLTLSASAQTHNYSSSTDGNAALLNEDIDGASLASPSPTPQYGQSNSYPQYQSRWSHLAIVAGGGLTSPIGNTGHYETFGGNLRLGGGWNFTKKFGLLGEFEFNSDKIPGAVLANVGAPGGHVHLYGITADPIYYYWNTQKVGAYAVGGIGFYHKNTIYTAPQPQQFCNYFYGYCGYGVTNVTIGQFSSNQMGLNVGQGFYWKAFGPDSHAKLFAEVRYEWIDSPKGTATKLGTGTENLIPFTIGLRF